MNKSPKGYLWFGLAVAMFYLGLGVIAVGMISMPLELVERLTIAIIGTLAMLIAGVFMAIHLRKTSGKKQGGNQNGAKI